MSENQEQQHKTWIMLKKGKRFVPCEPPTGLSTTRLQYALDGLYNSEGGHNPSAIGWYDIVQKKANTEIAINPSNWTDQGYRFKGDQYMDLTWESRIGGSWPFGQFTLELMIEPNTSNSGTLFSFIIHDSPSDYNWNKPEYEQEFTNIKATVEYRLNGTDVEYYLNGILKATYANARYINISSWVGFVSNSSAGYKVRFETIIDSKNTGTVQLQESKGTAYLCNIGRLLLGCNQSKENMLNCVVNSIRLHKIVHSEYEKKDFGWGDYTVNKNGGKAFTIPNQYTILAERFSIK